MFVAAVYEAWHEYLWRPDYAAANRVPKPAYSFRAFIVRRPNEADEAAARQKMHEFHDRKRIHIAAYEGDLQALYEELDKGVDVNLATGWFKETPLHTAVEQG